MFYTIIQKSGWAGDYWRIVGTYPNAKQQAKEVAESLRQPDATEDYYYVRVMAHRKPLHEFHAEGYGFGVYRFNDGTLAWNEINPDDIPPAWGE